MNRYSPDATLAVVVLSLAAWVVLAAMVLASLAPLGGLVTPAPAREVPAAMRVARNAD